LDFQSTDICYHCHQEFADHNYITDSIDLYTCPELTQVGPTHYGHPTTHDPNNFLPDPEMCSPEELEEHARIVAYYNIHKTFPLNMKAVGIGVSVNYKQTCFKLANNPNPSQINFEF